jgi:hypothetical protein
MGVFMGGMVFSPQEHQKRFFESTADFLCRVGPWADGKTLCMIMKIMYLCQLYPGNEALIIRSKFNALQRSTIRDFTTWTGITVPEQKKSVIIPGCDSTIHFAHTENMADFIDGIQGMNLGVVGIEQADEMDSPDIFEMFFGRVRRILTPREDIQRKLCQYKYLDKPVKDWAVFEREDREKLEKGIIETLRLPVRQIMVIANSCGHNWIWKRWHPESKERMGTEDGYEYQEGKPFENKEYIPDSTLRGWETLRKTSPKKYNRYVLNSHEDYDIEGAFYAALMSDALKENRLERQNLYDPTELVYTFWDLGISDDTVIWFAQFIQDRINLIDYYSDSGKGVTHYSKVLSEKKYEYRAHYLPHDVRQRQQGAEVTTRLDVLKKLRQAKHEDVFVVERHAVQERIQAVRDILRKCHFDEKTEKGVECLNRYHREVNKAKSTEEDKVFIDRPAHDKWSHGADGFGYMAIVHQNQTIDGVCLGATGPNPERWDDDYMIDEGVSDLLEVA